MLCVTTTSKFMDSFEWHINSGVPEKPVRVSDNYIILEVYADGDEFEYIKENCSNIPMVNKRGVSWYGEMAKFIVCNLKIVEFVSPRF